MADDQELDPSPGGFGTFFLYMLNASLFLAVAVSTLREAPEVADAFAEYDRTIPAPLQRVSDVGRFIMDHRWWALGFLAVAASCALPRKGESRRHPPLKALVATAAVLIVLLLLVRYAMVAPILEIGKI